MTARDRENHRLKLALAYWQEGAHDGRGLVGCVSMLRGEHDGYKWGLIEKVGTSADGDKFATLRAMIYGAQGMMLTERRITVPAWKLLTACEAFPIDHYARAER